MAYRDEVLADAPIDYYELESPAGTDSGNGGIALIPNGGITTDVVGKWGNGWAFDGTDDYASITSFPTLTSAFTFEAWVKAPAPQGMTASDYPTIIRRDGSDIVLLRVRASGLGVEPGQAEVYIAGTTLTSGPSYRVDDGNWHHVAFTQSGNQARLYIDGVQRASATTAQSTFNFGTGVGYIGYGGSSAEHFQGTLDEVAIYSTALSAARITAHANYVDAAEPLEIDAGTAGTLTFAGLQSPTIELTAPVVAPLELESGYTSVMEFNGLQGVTLTLSEPTPEPGGTGEWFFEVLMANKAMDAHNPTASLEVRNARKALRPEIKTLVRA